jgi:hypothetical protein
VRIDAHSNSPFGAVARRTMRASNHAAMEHARRPIRMNAKSRKTIRAE